jgi:hypothetical protein
MAAVAEDEMRSELLIHDAKIIVTKGPTQSYHTDPENPTAGFLRSVSVNSELSEHQVAALPLFAQKRLKQQENNRKAMRKLVWVVLLTVVFVGVEIMGGLLSHSIAILSDAAHLTSDALGIAISIIALKIAERPATNE